MSLASAASMSHMFTGSTLFGRVRGDVTCVLQRDPAARNVLEVALLYPGVHALVIYRVANSLWRRGVKFPARFLSWFGAARHQYRHPSRSDDRRASVHRPWRGRCDRRDSRHRQ